MPSALGQWLCRATSEVFRSPVLGIALYFSLIHQKHSCRGNVCPPCDKPKAQVVVEILWIHVCSPGSALPAAHRQATPGSLAQLPPHLYLVFLGKVHRLSPNIVRCLRIAVEWAYSLLLPWSRSSFHCFWKPIFLDRASRWLPFPSFTEDVFFFLVFVSLLVNLRKKNQAKTALLQRI